MTCIESIAQAALKSGRSLRVMSPCYPHLSRRPREIFRVHLLNGFGIQLRHHSSTVPIPSSNPVNARKGTTASCCLMLAA